RCNHEAMMRSGQVRARLLPASRAAFPEWLARHGIDCGCAEPGTDHVCGDARALEEYQADLQALAELGVRSEIIDGPTYLRDEPALREGVAGVVRYPDDASLRPDRYVTGMARALQAAGGELVENCEVRGITEAASGVDIATSTGTHRCADVVLAVGAWSPRLARMLKVPHLDKVMQPGKGYSITYSRPMLAPRRPLTLQERSVCVSTWGSGYRL